MSVWHRPHIWLVVKKFAGIGPPTLVRADDGKNGPAAPPPSSSIAGGTIDGFPIRNDAARDLSVATAAQSGTAIASAPATAAIAARRRPCALRRAAVLVTLQPRPAAPATPSTACAINSARWARVA